MDPIETVLRYHEQTKHRPQRYARSLGYMDWATQPDPFRRYRVAELLSLPLALGHPTPPYAALFEPGRVPAAPLCVESVSQLLQFSLGLAAWKHYGSDRWALRCNASSGNLHPTEAYLLLPPIPGLGEQSLAAHYAPEPHGLEPLASFETTFWETLDAPALLLGLSSVLWREAWKYGERSFRYCQLDAGHAFKAVETSAAMLGWCCRTLAGVTPSTIETMFGLDRAERFAEFERESADMLLLISPSELPAPDLRLLERDRPERFAPVPNRLSHRHHDWPILAEIDQATHAPFAESTYPRATAAASRSSIEAKTVILGRRSAQAMDPNRTTITRETFETLLRSVQTASFASCVHLVLFVHDVETLEPGLYCFVREAGSLERLKRGMDPAFEWLALFDGLYRLRPGRMRPLARDLSCAQAIASDGAFSLGMLAEFEPQLRAHGASRYKTLHFECGAIGQQLYLEATSLGLSATGIGCFLDDEMHALLGLSGRTYQSLYHFTVGRAIVDMRIGNEPPYASTEASVRQNGTSNPAE